MHASLFGLLTRDILADIDIWISVLENHDKFKHIISHFKYISNPVILSINSEYWTPYHNLKALQWYNIVKYNWDHRRIMVRD